MGEDEREPAAPDGSGSIRISEDWAATVLGLLLLGLALAGVITKAMVP
jgi:hypothetical protein